MVYGRGQKHAGKDLAAPAKQRLGLSSDRNTNSAPGPFERQAGYATTYNVTGAPYDFSFVTVRLAGHMVPTFQPASAYTFFSRFMAKTPF